MSTSSARQSGSVPQSIRPLYEDLTHRTDAFCREHADEETAMLCRKLAAALARKRPSPLARGKPEVWAAAIAYAIAQINFLFDRSQTPHTTPGELSDFFGAPQATASNKAKQIRDLMKIRFLDVEWSRPSTLDRNPTASMAMVNGLLVDARDLPRPL